jgi:hypothetical protein
MKQSIDRLHMNPNNIDEPTSDKNRKKRLFRPASRKPAPKIALRSEKGVNAYKPLQIIHAQPVVTGKTEKQNSYCK